MFLEARADETDQGMLVPLPELATVPRCDGQDVAYDEGILTYGDVMLACADAIRYGESVKGGVATMAEEGDSPSLCSVIDEIVRLVISDCPAEVAPHYPDASVKL